MSTEDLIKNGKHFCILPWIHFHAWPNGDVLPCCVADSSKPVSKIENGQSLLDMMNSEEYKNMRLKMLADEEYEPCTRCYELEEVGTWTMRQSQNTVRGMDCIDLVDLTNADGSIDEFKLKYMDIRFSNLCNYKCRSCGPACSNLWAEEKFREMGHDREQFSAAFKLKDLLVANTDDNDFMTQLKKHLHEVEECYFAGGEILVQPEHYECLDYWVEHGLEEQVHLNYTTNMSKLVYRDKNGQRDLFDYWKRFPKIEVWASIDDMGERAELLRKGTHWERVVENLKRIKAEVPHVQLSFTPTISLWNIWTYCELFEFLYEEGLIDPDNVPRLNILTVPACAAISVLPKQFALPLKAKYEEYQARYDRYTRDDDSMRRMKNTFGIIITALNKAIEYEKGHPDLFMDFMEENDRMDESRDEDFLDVIPELRDVYEWAKRECLNS